jgi:hypothetical protein
VPYCKDVLRADGVFQPTPAKGRQVRLSSANGGEASISANARPTGVVQCRWSYLRQVRPRRVRQQMAYRAAALDQRLSLIGFEPHKSRHCVARLPRRIRAAGQALQRLAGVGCADLFQHPHRAQLPALLVRPHGPHLVE